MPDQELMRRNPDYGWEFINGSVESYIQGIDGVVQEWKLYVADWGIDVASIEFPIALWYGSEDNMAPKERGIYYHQKLPNSTLNLVTDEGHFSLVRNHLSEILIELKHSTNNK
jgi:pimeloyl-ACP methyl ester carboxylesterase